MPSPNPQFTDGDLRAISEAMKEYPPAEVEKDYRLGKISLNDKLYFLQRYGQAQREIAVRSETEASKPKDLAVQKSGQGLGPVVGPAWGEMKYYGQSVAKEFVASWNAATAEGGGKKSEAVFHALMGSLDALKAFDIPGDTVERWFLEAFPEAPGLARAANWAVWIPANFGGLTAILKAPVTGAGKIMRGTMKGLAAVGDYGTFIKDPVKYAVKQAVTSEAVTATKLAKATAENVTRKGVGVAGAAVDSEQNAINAIRDLRIQAVKDNPHFAQMSEAGRWSQVEQERTRDMLTSAQLKDLPDLNPKVKSAIDELNSRGIKTQLSGDMYGDAGVYIDLSDPRVAAALQDAKLPSGWKLIRTDAPAFDAHVANTADNLAESAFKSGDYGQMWRLARAGGSISGKEARQLADAIEKVAPKELLAPFKAFKVAEPATAKVGTIPAPAFATPQELETKTTAELIKHYEERAAGMLRSKSNAGPGVSNPETKAAATTFSLDEIAARAPDAPISGTELESIGAVHDEVSKSFNAILYEASKFIPEISAGQRPDLVQAYKSHIAAMEITNPAFLSGREQSGRSLQYLKTMQDLVRESKVFDTLTRALSSEKLLEGNNAALAQTIQKMYLLGKEERSKMISSAGREDFTPGTMRLVYKSLLFSRPGIHAANILGNLESLSLHGVNKTLSAYLDPFSSTTMREANAYWSGMWDARKKFGDIWQKAAERSSMSLEKAGIEGAATGKMVQYGPLGWLGFEDEVMHGVVEHGLAKSRAVSEGLSAWDAMREAGTAGTSKRQFLAQFVDDAMANPATYERLTEATKPTADYILFHSPLSRGGEKVAQVIRETPLDYLMPVVKFPINAMKMSRDWTPGLQMLSKDFMGKIAQGGAAADEVRSRMALSWMIFSQVYEAAKAGVITGDGPSNPEANAVWRGAGNTPRAIHGIPIQWAEPLGTLFAFAADIAHNASEMDDNSLQQAFQAVLTAGAQAVQNNYFLRIAEGVTGAVSDVLKVRDLNDIFGAVAKLGLQPAKTVVSGGTAGRAFMEGINPQQPDLKFYGGLDGELTDLKNWFFAGTPFGTDTRPRLNYSGKIQMVPPVLGATWINEHLGTPDWFGRSATALMEPPMRINSDLNDPVAKFIYKHGLVLHDNWKSYGGTADLDSPLPAPNAKPAVGLTGDQAYNWKLIALNHALDSKGKTWGEAISALDQDPRFLAKGKNDKQLELNRLYARFRKDGIGILKAKDPEIIQKEAERDQAWAEQKGRPFGSRPVPSLFSTQENAPLQTTTEEPAPPTDNPPTQYVPIPEVPQ